MDFRSRQNYPSRQTRAPSVRFHPLDIPVDEYPHVHFFLSLGTPGRLLGVPSGAEFGPAHRWMRAQASDISEPVTSKKLKSFATPSLDLHSFCRMLAKIGH